MGPRKISREPEVPMQSEFALESFHTNYVDYPIADNDETRMHELKAEYLHKTAIRQLQSSYGGIFV